ncbi:DUF1365 domain-containing protein [Vibrio proteolyticus]|uniref:DUF1365 domain-containing protein n=1 Tax=Vibrio proteolyticus NBRC 13287 TaxID=1219065 RepID=U3B8E4_VIBPR|nr:DUF1365 family protein [Vibrio proteolyticus]GAD66114.1 hypothetical protein VPR01S_03_00220 [Vibrio proteolyticus NBRC 13287]
MAEDLNSRLFVGTVRHRRFTPLQHALHYRLFMPCIDLDELSRLEQRVWLFGRRWFHWARFRREDYLGQGDLKHAVRDKVFELTGVRCAGRVEAVIHLRYLGVYFSPVNFYYLYDLDGNWCYLLAEVSNTPWNERHYYAIPAQGGDANQHWQHQKAFHVSPFNPIGQHYQWRLKPLVKSLVVHLECHQDGKVFDATLAMKPKPFQSGRLLFELIKTPVMAVKVVAGIYWHALKLWVKGAPLYSHPKYHSKSQKK